MKRALVGGTLALAMTCGGLYFVCAGSPDEGAAHQDISFESREASRTGVMNAVLNAPLPESNGTRSIRGKVVGPSGPVAQAIVTATVAQKDEALSTLQCQCDKECG